MQELSGTMKMLVLSLTVLAQKVEAQPLIDVGSQVREEQARLTELQSSIQNWANRHELNNHGSGFASKASWADPSAIRRGTSWGTTCAISHKQDKSEMTCTD